MPTAQDQKSNGAFFSLGGHHLGAPVAPELCHVVRELQKVASQLEEEMGHVHAMMRDVRRAISSERSDSRTRGLAREMQGPPRGSELVAEQEREREGEGAMWFPFVGR